MTLGSRGMKIEVHIWMPLKVGIHLFEFISRWNHNYLIHMSMGSYFELYLLVEGCIQSDFCFDVMSLFDGKIAPTLKGLGVK
jgi:hypothetical protein